MELNKIYQGDCLEIMKQIEDKSIDMILCDLPYGITDCKWDVKIPLYSLWKEYERIISDNGVIILFSLQPYTSQVVNSNLDIFRYELIWNKIKPSGMFNANKMPMRVHENVLVFYKSLPTYNPQKTEREKKDLRPNRVKNSLKKPYKSSDVYVGKNIAFSKNYEEDKVNPKSIIEITTINNFSDKRVHPTQKPVALFEYLIKTYTNEGDLVLDNCIGSGTTAVACIKTNRNFIGIELSPEYCQIANKRINEAKEQLTLFQKNKCNDLQKND